MTYVTILNGSVLEAIELHLDDKTSIQHISTKQVYRLSVYVLTRD